jgi:serine phosphatase RsbU (regulator of sigma subunit)
MKIISLLGFFFLFNSSIYCQNTDSLWQVWNDAAQKDSVRLQAMNEIAWGYLRINPDSAILLGQQQFDYAKSNQLLFWQSKALNTIGVGYTIQGDFPKALSYQFDNITILETLDNQPGLGKAYNNISRIYYQQEEYETALEYLFKSIDIKKKLGDKKGLAYAYNNVGTNYEIQGKFKEALTYYEQSLTLKLEISDEKGLPSAYNNIGALHNSLGNYKKGLVYYEKGLALAKRQGDKDRTATLYINIGLIQLDLNEDSLAIFYCEKAYDLAKRLASNESVKFSCDCLWKGWEKKGDDKKALAYYKEYNAMHELLIDEAKTREISMREAAYEYEKLKYADSVAFSQEKLAMRKEQERKDAITAKKHAEAEKKQAISDAKQKQQQTFTIALIAGLALVLLFALFVYNRFRVTRKQKEIIEDQKDIVEEKNKEILDSITYAKRIQNAILPPANLIKSNLPNSFVLYKPKDIVAGDFYWLQTSDDLALFAAADCTGHGVPGAMVSVVCSNALNQSVKEQGLTDPGRILDATRQLVMEQLTTNESGVKDGMDISLCALNTKTKELQWAGANNPLWIIPANSERHAELIEADVNRSTLRLTQSDLKAGIIEIKANKQPIGKTDNPEPFKTHQIQLEKGDNLYIFTDGFADQFGGEREKKYKSKPFKQLLVSIQHQTLAEQCNTINTEFEEWKGDLEQVDDVCIIGVRI